ncbi:sugar-binding protein [Bacteroidota bacterium]
MRYIVFILLILCLNFKFYSQEDTNYVDKPEVTFYYANKPILIDGTEYDQVWQAVTATDHLGYHDGTNPDITKTDLSYRFKGVWDETGIYLLVEVTDDALVRHLQEEQQSTECWLTDHIEYYFNPDGKRSLEPTDNNFIYSSVLHINPGDEELDIPFIRDRVENFHWVGTEDPEGIIFKYGITYPSNGYIIESWFSWNAILPDTIYDVVVKGLPKQWGFSINVNDSDDPEIERDAVGLWAGAGLNDHQWHDVNYLGVMHLSNNLAFPEIDLPYVTLENIFVYIQKEGEYIGNDHKIDFGKVEINKDSIRSIVIYNGRAETLKSYMRISGKGFKLLNASPVLNIDPETLAPITIEFNPDSVDQFLGELIFYTTDGIFYTLNLIGVVDGYVDINNSYENEITIYPNPAHNYIYIDNPISDTYKIEIYDMLGRKLLLRKCRNNEKINISSLKKGSYWIKLYQNNIAMTKTLIIK